MLRKNHLSELNLNRKVLLVDPDEAFCQVLPQVLGTDYRLRAVTTIETAITQFDDVDVLLLNLDSAGAIGGEADALSFMRSTADREYTAPVVAYGWDARGKKSIAAFQHGAFDFLEQPLNVQALKFALDAAFRRATVLRRLSAAQKMLPPSHVDGLVGNSKSNGGGQRSDSQGQRACLPACSSREKAAPERRRGSAIHDLSQRADKPFVAFSPAHFQSL